MGVPPHSRLLEEGDARHPDFQAHGLLEVAEAGDEDGRDFFVDGGQELGAGSIGAATYVAAVARRAETA